MFLIKFTSQEFNTCDTGESLSITDYFQLTHIWTGVALGDWKCLYSKLRWVTLKMWMFSNIVTNVS